MNDIIPPKRKKFESPYSTWETVKWLWKNVRIRKKNPGNIQFIPKVTKLNEITPKYNLVFIGDVMDLGHKHLEVSPELKAFIEKSDYFIANFEATITDAEPRGMDQVHDEKVIIALKEVYPPSKTFLSVTNNHSADFGQEIFEDSVKKVNDAGFNTFGRLENPFIDLNPNICLNAATMWSNRKCDFIAKLEDISSEQLKKGSMNILYPHWGYDLELYPRLPIIELAKQYLLDFDAIIGHHTHAPQPITISKINDDNLTKLCAYSLGDFCFGKILPKYLYNYNYGLIIKAEIGTTDNGNWAIGTITWSFTECIRKDSETMLVDLKDTNPYYPNIK